MVQFRARQRANRKTKVQPSQRNRAKKKARLKAGERYDVSSYYHAVLRACDRAGVTRFFPHQLRHAAATRVAGDGDGDLRGAQALLGHAELRTTEGYARLKISGAVSAAARAAG
jgi:integrase